jgi:hypothetical protein
MRIFVPPPVIDRYRAVTLSGSVNGVPWPSERYQTAGNDVYERRIPRKVRRATSLRFEFSLACALPPDASDQRERG